MRSSQTPKDLAAENWYGYGRWSAPFWFIGKEPGGVDDAENYDSWVRLGATDLIDCREHDLEYRGENRGLWHVGAGGNRPRLQSTWRPLIALLLAYHGDERYDVERIRHYQAECWGRLQGETCVIELSAVAAPSTQSAETSRLSYLERRIAIIQEKITANGPKFVLFYGTGSDPVYHKPYAEYWQAIARVSLDVGEPRRAGSTVYCITQHPTAHGLRNEYWVQLGRRIAGMTDATTRMPCL